MAKDSERPPTSGDPLTEAEKAIEDAKAALRKSQKEVKDYLSGANKKKSSEEPDRK